MPTALSGVATSLPLQVADGDVGLFPRARVYDSAGSLSATVDLSHVAFGLYRGAHTFGTEEVFDVVYVVYTDAGHTIESTTHGRTSERWEVGVPVADQVWDEDVVAGHGGSDTAGLLLRALGADISGRSNNATLDALLGVADSPGETVVTAVSGSTTIEVVQSWSRSLGPSTLHGVLYLRVGGGSVPLPGPAELEVVGYDQAGSVLFTQSGIFPTTVGGDSWFEVDQALALVSGAVISVRGTITNSGFGTGTHVGLAQIVTPEF